MKKIELVYTLKSPLSHIGESSSTTSFLNDLKVVTESGLEEIFIYTGNAFRGLFRDLAARHLMERIGGKTDIDSFHLLFSGGNIGGTQTADIDQARNIRKNLPMVSLFGGGVGNQILEGGMRVGFGYPVCKETENMINAQHVGINPKLLNVTNGELTNDIEFTRADDSKGEQGEKYLEDVAESGKKKAGSASTQMRYEVEYLVPGSQLYQEIFLDCEPVEVGALYKALADFALSPFLGGMGNKGFGKVDFVATMDGERIISFVNGVLSVSEQAQTFIDNYEASIDDFLMSGQTIKEVLAVPKK